MEEKNLIIHVPVLHKGYLDFFSQNSNRISRIYLIAEGLLEELSEFKPDIASIDTKTAKDLLEKLGFQNVLVLNLDNIGELKGKDIILVQDEISRNLFEKYLKEENVEWASVFLRWDKSSILSELPTDKIRKSAEAFDVEMIKEAYKEAEKSSDWWRQIGAVLVRDKKILARSYNQGVPNDNSPYQLGSARDLFKAGEKQEFSPTIHAEQKIIAEAARDGIQLKGASLYLTHFPCPVCSKLIASAGVKDLYFVEGSANLDGQRVLESVGVSLIYVKCSNT